MPEDALTPSPWSDWRARTPARIALGRVGAGLPTDEVLRFGWAHAMARDAIHARLDLESLGQALRAEGFRTETVRSQAPDRATYLRRPDLGRQLDPEDADRLRANRGHGPPDGPRGGLCIVVGDGLSSLAIERHAVPLLAALKLLIPEAIDQRPIVLATQARVALADEVAQALDAELSIMLIGERPGLSSPDSLGIYITHAPRKGKRDAERNCISNIRPEGLSYQLAAFKLAWLVREALRRGLTGVQLKDESDQAVIDGTPPAALPGEAQRGDSL